MPDTLCSAGANIMLGGSSMERLTQAIRRKGDLREARSCFEMGQLISLYDAFLKKSAVPLPAASPGKTGCSWLGKPLSTRFSPTNPTWKI